MPQFAGTVGHSQASDCPPDSQGPFFCNCNHQVNNWDLGARAHVDVETDFGKNHSERGVGGHGFRVIPKPIPEKKRKALIWRPNTSYMEVDVGDS